ncbi:division/cell wall cluster transcriptional repressor MraZ [Candidatus Aerophobetes bacterium]|nr:division/cell wall cluster transcriptional repressor MraZ [Candidatus Aerophobetes bacterium]
MFIGEYRHTIDEKNRLIIPSVFRQVFEKEKESCVITKGLDKSIFLYPFSEWQELGNRLKNLSTNRSDVRAFLRIFFSGAHFVKPDTQGRITIPQTLKDFAGIRDKVAIIGAFNKVEIWDEKVWDNYYQQKKEIYEEITEKIMDLGI